MTRTWPLTDLGNAERLAYQHGDTLRHVAGIGWLSWDGKRWRRDETGAAMRAAKLTVRSIFREAAAGADPETRARIAKWATGSESASRLKAMVELARTDASIAITVEQLDANPWLLNCQNGTIDLRTGSIREHRRDDLITKLAPVAYDPAAVAPLWDAFIGRVLGGDAELMTFVKRFFGYSLTGTIGEQIIVFGHGEGANGKSTKFRLLQDMMGDYAMQGAPDLLLAKTSDGHPTEQADLLGARLVVCQEIEEGRRWAESTIKQLTGGDRIKARRMRQDFFEFDPTHKIVVAANHKPRVRGTDLAIWRRIRLIPYSVVIPESERDPQLPAKLRAELPGILAWAVRGCIEWQAHGLGCPKAVREATDEYRQEEDLLGRFLSDCCIVESRVTASARSLYQAYTAWCDENGERQATQTAFGKALSERGIKRDRDTRTGRKFYFGVGLLTGSEGSDPESRFSQLGGFS